MRDVATVLMVVFVFVALVSFWAAIFDGSLRNLWRNL